MPDGVQVSDANFCIKVAEQPVVDPSHNGKWKDYHCPNAELINSLRVIWVFQFNSPQFLEQQIKRWNDKTHQRERINYRIPNRHDSRRDTECQHQHSEVLFDDFWKISTRTEENHRARVSKTKN